MMTFELPWPPSINHYWRHVGNRVLISREGVAFRRLVMIKLGYTLTEPLKSRLEVRVDLHPPDRRRRDIDNVAKALLDAIQHAGLYEDDSQIDRLMLERKTMKPKGGVVVWISEIETDSGSV